MKDTKTIIEQAYSAFNKRDIDGALALMTQDVSWPKGFGGQQGCRKRRDPRLLDSTMG
jgi:ketosteroid isomerase-like protein